MIRLCILAVLTLLCLLISAVRSQAAEPAFQSRPSEFRQPREMSGNPNTYSRTTQRGVAPTTTGREGLNRPQPVNSGIAPSQSRSLPQQRVPVQAKPAANPITPLDRQKQANSTAEDQASPRRVPSIWGTFGALALVIGIILIAAKVMKKHNPLSAKTLPREVLEVLGKRPLDARQTIHFVRCGNRILILGSSPAGLETLSEVLDRGGVDLITGMCREQADSSRANQSFLNLFQSTQQKTPTARTERKPERVQPPVRSEAEPETTQDEYPEFDSAMSRLQQKLLQPSRHSLNETGDRDHV
ncbi:MAG: flagellar biosynthetic protein FliO [Gimesia chilikensis]